ncbi:MAG: porin family protein [Pseudomonadota bacterium]|nr:porin family protein [Pseudomonadota bacterium]
MRKLGALCAAALLGLPLTAMAEGLSYSYLEGGYVSSELDDGDVEADGFRAKLSVLINEGVYVHGGYAEAETDENAIGATFTTKNITAGLGVRFALFDATDLNIEGAWLNGKLERDGAALDTDVEDDGYTIGAGVRHLFFPQLEAGLKADYSDIFDDDDFAYTGSVLFHVIPALSIGGSYTIADNADTWTAGLRFNF